MLVYKRVNKENLKILLETIRIAEKILEKGEDAYFHESMYLKYTREEIEELKGHIADIQSMLEDFRDGTK